jgi:murein DD-endopeptidase MepM/ murein hydrolase activator NlpD
VVQALAFAELLAGGILFLCGYKGYTPAEVVKGEAGEAKPLGKGSAGAESSAGSSLSAPSESVAAGGAALTHEGYAYPFAHSQGLAEERVDQGQDFAGTGPIAAIGDAVVRYAGPSNGWPGQYIAYQLTSGKYAGKIVYVAEGVTPHVRVGQKVKAGDTIGTFVKGSSTGIETGWASPSSPFEPIAKSEPGGYKEGQATNAGNRFAQFLQQLLVGSRAALNHPPATSAPQLHLTRTGQLH